MINEVFLEELKSKTRSLHKLVEQTAISRAIISPELTHDQYKRYLQKMLQMHTAVEKTVFPVVLPYVTDIADRYKSGKIISDLKRLTPAVDIDPGNFIDRHFIPTVNFCFGMMYVIEGSTLGGIYIAKNVVASLGKEQEVPTSFLNVYRQETGRKWKDFLHTLTEYRESINEGEAAELIDGSIYAFNRTFELFNTN